MKRIDPFMAWFLRTFVVAAGILCIAVFALSWKYHSWQTALSVLRGEPLVIVPTRLDLGGVVEGEPLQFQVDFFNETGEAVSVLGVDDCCYCRLESESTSISVPAHSRTTLTLIFDPGAGLGDNFRRVIPLITTSTANRPYLEVVGQLKSPAVAVPDR